MLDNKWLFEVLHQKDLNNTDKVLIVLLDQDMPAKSISEITEIHRGQGCEIKNIPQLLGAVKKRGIVAQIKDQWKLTPSGREELSKKGLLPPQQTPLIQVQNDLRTHLSSIQNPEVKSFVEESILCLEAKALRSAVVMSWLGAIARLQTYILDDSTRLSDFNNEATQRFTKQNKKWKPAKTGDDFSEMPENEFLEILRAISVIGKNAKEELKKCLDRRNACAHPNSFQIGEQQVAAHIETIILNVYAKL